MERRPPRQPSAPHPCPSLKSPPEVLLQLKVVGLFKGIPFQVAKCTAERPMVFLEITVNKRPIGRLVFELYADLCPKTCHNFQTLCTGKAGFSRSGLKLHYKNTIFHRLVKNGWLQGGDINMGKGDGGESIYGPVFEDENFAVPHDKRGVLGMANQGRHTNGSQFYITLQKAPYLDRKYVAFGQLIEGTRVLQILEVVDTVNERPVYACRIIDCGNFR
ncbi:probable inactive peptidyl-prolyl cis-trans isomerase-like 6 isoform X5 [Notamacropus eugenii]|uniref:probable inactive peptidyl-prolyl cis-trans isomerase-like 6 isoform X5 n=1 Tax=Notamacropus eugenii TaxID=9315 RepID=UPI003B66CA3D